MRSAFIAVLALALSACGMGRAVHQTGQLADKYGCLSRELKGEAPCQPEAAPAQQTKPAAQ